MVRTWVITESFQDVAPGEIDGEYVLDDARLMVNVGSIGQSGDGDSRACHVILDDGPNEGERAETHEVAAGSPRIMFRRVASDFETTIPKIQSMGSP